jgi:hypothetical protein
VAALKFAVKQKARFAKENIMAKKEMKDEFDAIREAQALREMSDDASNAKRAMDQAEQMDKVMTKIKEGKARAPESFDGMPSKEDIIRRVTTPQPDQLSTQGMKKGGSVKKMAKGGMVKSSASKRADGIAVKGKTRGKIC